MTNAELNLAIAKLVYKGFEPYQDPSGDDVHLWTKLASGRELNLVKNYLNNWNDLMPLVVEYKISLVYLGYDRWKSESDWDFEKDSSIEILGVPQRALAECLLKVLEAKQ